MNQADKNKLGLVFGGFSGLAHLVWSGLVILGLAQPLINFIFKLHMIEPAYQVLPFSLKKAAALVVLTSFVGYLAGWLIGAIWNKVHQS